MNSDNDRLINELAASLRPMSPMRQRNGQIMIFGALLLTVVIGLLVFGLTIEAVDSMADPLFVIVNGLLLLLGAATALTVIAMAQPQVGSDHTAPFWAMTTVTLLPIAAAGAAILAPDAHQTGHIHDADIFCFGLGSAFAMITAAMLLFWLRRGAPASPERAGLFLGVASGAMGSFAYGLFCPIASIGHLGIWHVLPVLFWGVIGRIAVPKLIRW